MDCFSKESRLGLEKRWFLMSLCLFSVAHAACAGTHILVRQHSAKGQGNYTFPSSKWTCSSGRTFKKLPEVVLCQFSGLNKPHRWWGNFQSWQRRKSRITSGQRPLQQLHLWGEGEFSRGARRDRNSATEKRRLKRKGPVGGDFFRKHLNDNFSDATVELLFKVHFILCSTKPVILGVRSPFDTLTLRRCYSLHSQFSALRPLLSPHRHWISFPSRMCKHRESICLQASRNALRRAIRHWHKRSLSDLHWVTAVSPRPHVAFWKHQPLGQWKGHLFPVPQSCYSTALVLRGGTEQILWVAAWWPGLWHCSLQLLLLCSVHIQCT